MLLEDIVKPLSEAEISKQLDSIAEKISIYEAVRIDPINDKASIDELMNLMGDAILKFTAARKGLGIANKLKNAEDRKKHKGAILSNFSKLNGLIRRIDKKMAALGGAQVNEAKGAKGAEGGFKQFDKLAQKVWAAKDVAGKKAVLNQMVGAFKYKDKQQKFLDKIERETNANKLDKLAADLMQVGHGNTVIR